MERVNKIDHVIARIGGVEYKVQIPMTRQTMEALRQAQAGRSARRTDQIQPAQKK